MFKKKLKAMFHDFAREDDGSYTVEIVLWFPALLVAFQFVTDATVSLMYQQNFYDTARDASRMVALGQRTTEQAKSWIEEELDPREWFRINRAQIIQVEAITKAQPYFNHRLVLELSPKGELDNIVSRPRARDFKEWLGR